MNETKSISACLVEIKQREVGELFDSVKKLDGKHYVFDTEDAPCVCVMYDEGPANIRVGSVAIENLSDMEILVIYDTEGNQLKPCDIAYGNIEFIKDSLPYVPIDKVSFVITELTREDLNVVGFDASNVTDIKMERLANKLSEDYCNQLFWISLENIAEQLKIPRKQK